MPTYEAAAVLRGKRGSVSNEDLVTAGRIVLEEREHRLRVAVWARRLVEATEPDDVARARRGLSDALGGDRVVTLAADPLW